MTKKTLKIIDDTLKEIKALDTKILNLKKINFERILCYVVRVNFLSRF